MKTKFLIILSLFSFILFSCWKREYTYYKITDTDINMIPYRLEQTVNFIDSLELPFVMTVKEDYITWVLYSDIVKGECRSVILQSKKNSLPIELLVGASENEFEKKYISIYINPFGFWIRYDLDGQFVTDTEGENKQYFHDSIEINNKIYYNVVEYIKVEDFGYNDEILSKDRLPMRLIYNKTEGILQLEDKDKVLFSIVNKDD